MTVERERLQEKIAELTGKFGTSRYALISVLRGIQDEYGYISDHAMQDIATALNLLPMQVQEVVTFYSFLSREKLGKFVIRLAMGTPREIALMGPVERQFENELGIEVGETTDDGMFTLLYTSCIGMSDQAPAIMVNNKVYTEVDPEKVHDIILELRKKFGKLDPNTTEHKKNLKKAGGLLEKIECKSKCDAPLTKALEMKRVDIINEIRESGLRGRGGAGFPTSVKWQLAAAAKGEKKIVICNADEGEPGTFKDRLLLTDYICGVFDGMTIAGYAIGADKGYLYLRGEYTFMLDKIEEILEHRRKAGLLGKNIKEGFDFDIEVHMGAGAYICGEETALIESLEGFRGEPRNRPPFPVTVGFCGEPSIVNNVETFLAAAKIIDKGAAWFKGFGTEKSAGLKLFSVSGDCDEPGIYELPYGITVRELLKEVGGEDAKAVQIGGASGRTVPRSQFDRVIGYEDLSTGGSVMVLGHGQDMLQVSADFMDFFVEESCGQCTPCRIGCVRLLDGIEMLQEGECSITHLKKLKELAQTMQKASKCGLGQSAPNAFLDIVENFKDEVLGR